MVGQHAEGAERPEPLEGREAGDGSGRGTGGGSSVDRGIVGLGGHPGGGVPGPAEPADPKRASISLSGARTVIGRLRGRFRGSRAMGRKRSGSGRPTPFQRRLARFRAVLPSRSKRTVVVLTAEVGADCQQLIAEEFAGDRVFVIGADPALSSSFTSVPLPEASLPAVEDALVRMSR